jgi:hypothetical protein
MEKVKIYSNFSRGLQLLTMCFALVMTQFSASAQAVACIGQVNLSISDANGVPCTVTATPALVGLPAGVVTIQKSGQMVPAVFTGSDVGKTYKYSVTVGTNTCWGFVTIEDKQAPKITCPADVTLLCSVMAGLNTPTQAMTGDLGLDGIVPTATGAKDGTAKDCTMLMAADESYTDYVFETSCQKPYASSSSSTTTAAPTAAEIDAAIKGATPTTIAAQVAAIVAQGDVYKVIVRCWKAVDHYGNISEPCYQVIGIKNITYAILAPKAKMYSCDGAVNRGGTCIFEALPANLTPANTGYPVLDVNANGIVDAGDIELTPAGLQACNLDISAPSDMKIDVCTNSYKVVRTFTVKNWCSGVTTTLTQEIKVLDMSKPAVRTTFTTFDRVAKTYCYVDAWGVSRTRTAYDVVAKPGVLADFTGENLQCGYNTDGTVTTLNALADPNNCNRFRVSFDFIACDPKCTNDVVSLFSNNSDIRITGGTLVTDANGGKSYRYRAEGFLTVSGAQIDNTFEGVGECNPAPLCHDVTFTAKDVCGYATAKQTFRIRLVDNAAPQAVCISSHTASVGTDGTVRVNATTFNNGSSDNCGISMFMVRRMTGTSGKCGITIPAGTCYADYVDFACGDVDQTVMVEMLVVDQNCNINSCMVEVKVQNKQKPVCVAPAPAEIKCTEVASKLTNLGQFGEAYSFNNCGYSVFEKAASTSLDQCGIGSITRNFGVRDCNGVEVSVGACTQRISVTGLSDFSVDFPDDVILGCAGSIPSADALKAQMLNPTSWNTRDGAIKNDGCGVLVVNIVDQTFMATTGIECMKVLRKITVIDWCKYNPNNDLVDQDANCYGMPITGDFHTPGAKANNSCDWGNLVRPAGVDCRDRRYRDADGLTGPSNDPTNPIHPLSYSDGIICHIQTIKVIDRTAPTLVNQPDATVCFAKGACSGAISATLSASDICDAGTASTSALTYTWTILTTSTGKAGGTETVIASGTGANVSRSGLAAGAYTVRWTAADQCGNQQTIVDEFVVTLKDCEAPFLLVHEKVAELSYVLGQGTAGAMAMVDVELDLLNNVSDNCTSYDYLVGKLTVQKASAPVVYPTTKTVMLTCADIPSVSLRVWTIDEAGNPNWVLTTVKVQANAGQCGPVTPIVPLLGAVGTENGKAVKGTTITAKAANAPEVNSNTINDGSFTTMIIRDQNYVVGATKVDASDKFLGVTTFDIAKISKHLLDIEKMASPYSLIAADVDMSGEIDGADMLKIRNFILRKSDHLNTTNPTIWRFVDKSYTFKNAASPLTEDFSTVVSLKKVGDRSVANFVAVKLGDVNTTYTGEAVATVRNAKTLNFVTEDINVIAGNEYTVNIAAENFNAAAFQGTFSFTNATVKAAKGSLLTDANMAIFSNAITASWNGNAQANDIVAITFVANKSGKLSEVLTINSALTEAVANDVNGTEMNLNLKFTNGAVAGGEFALNNASPNPVKFETTIGFNLPKDSKATLTVYTTEGKVLSVKNVDAKAGANQITLTKGDLNATGVMYYRLETADFSATKKMIVIE